MDAVPGGGSPTSIDHPIIVSPLELVPVASTSGHIAYMPRQMVQALQATGEPVTFQFGNSDRRPWHSLADAARIHSEDIFDLTENGAKSAIIRAVNNGHIKSTGHGRARRLDPITFDAWRLKRQEADAGQHDALG